MTERIEKKLLIAGGGPGGRVSYSMARNIGIDDIALVINDEPTVVCSLPYGLGRKHVPGGPEDEVVDLARSPRLPKDIVKDVIKGHVTEMDTDKKVATVKTEKGQSIEIIFDKAILAPGAVPWIPPIEGVLAESSGKEPDSFTQVMIGRDFVPKNRLADNLYVMRGADDTRNLDSFAAKAKTAVVVGTGAIGLETAEALLDRGLGITLIEALPHPVPFLDDEMSNRVRKKIFEKNIKLLENTQVTKVLNNGVQTSDGKVIEADGIVFATGVRPNTDLAAKSGLKTEKGIVTDEFLRTSCPDIFALGDAAQVKDAPTGQPILPLIGTLAMRQAMFAVMNIAGMERPFPPVTVWGLTQFYGLSFGSVGWSEEMATKAGYKVKGISLPYVTRGSEMPAMREGTWKVTVASEDSELFSRGQIIGFQIVLEEESPLFLVERFIDIVTRRENVLDLSAYHFVHCPMHNDVMDPYMGFMAKARKVLG